MVEPRFKIKADVENQTYGKFTIEPLTQGYGHTLGTALRRVLLSSLKGAAVTLVKIGGVKHQFSTLPGLKEDIVELILNIKKIRLQYDGEEPIKMKLSAKGKGPITADQIEAPAQVTIADKDTYLGTLTDTKAKLSIEFWVESGYGYSPFEERKGGELGLIPIDAIFTPIRRVNYKVESTRVGRMTDLDKLIVEIWTDGNTKPMDALREASRILREYLSQIYSPKEEVVETKENNPTLPVEVARLTLEELDLPTRITNALRNGGIETIGDLVALPHKDLLRIKNVGGKSLGIVEEELKKKGVTLPTGAE